jgi:tetratricopeptide (TPR) repeat protein
MLHNGVDYGWLLYAPASLTWALIGAQPFARGEGRGVWSVERGGASDSASDVAPIQSKIQNPKSKILTGVAFALTLLSFLPAYGEWKAIQGEDALEKGDLATAQQDYAAASSVDFTEPQWPRRLGEIQRGMGDAKAAIPFYEDALYRDPLRAAHYYRLALAYEAAREPNRAEVALQRALELDSNSIPALMKLGAMEDQRGHHEAAMKAYRKVAQVQDSPVGKVTALAEMENPEYAAARYVLAKDALDRGDKTEAARQAEAGIESADRYINGMTTTWKKVMEASGQPSEELDRQIQNAKDMKTRLELIRSQAQGRRP